MIGFENIKQKLFPEDILVFEKKYSVKLPQEYINHMLVFNGGYPENDVYFDRYPIDGFRSIKYGNHTVEDDIDSLSEFLPDQSIPFAYSTGGYIYMALNKKDNGKIYITYSDGQTNFLANSFKEFIKGLSEEQEL